MAKAVTVVVTEEEARFLLGALDRVEIQGIASARCLASVAEKISVASRFASEKVEPSRAPLEQALLARVTTLPRGNGDGAGKKEE